MVFVWSGSLIIGVDAIGPKNENEKVITKWPPGHHRVVPPSILMVHFCKLSICKTFFCKVLLRTTSYCSYCKLAWKTKIVQIVILDNFFFANCCFRQIATTFFADSRSIFCSHFANCFFFWVTFFFGNGCSRQDLGEFCKSSFYQ